ncbi:MAG: hypothetical protein E7486_03980 [Ruminococcaceae bacterium]|nr:hypothetical protein [Oscillospiraceae bacterium]
MNRTKDRFWILALAIALLCGALAGCVAAEASEGSSQNTAPSGGGTASPAESQLILSPDPAKAIEAYRKCLSEFFQTEEPKDLPCEAEWFGKAGEYDVYRILYEGATADCAIIEESYQGFRISNSCIYFPSAYAVYLYCEETGEFMTLEEAGERLDFSKIYPLLPEGMRGWDKFSTPPEKEPEEAPNGDEKILKAPPALRVKNNVSSIPAIQGGTSWMYYDGEKNISIEADAPHPLEMKEKMTPLVFSSAEEGKVSFHWETAPDKMTLSCWDADSWGGTDAEEEWIPLDGPETAFSAQLPNGSRIYEVVAVWNRSEKYCGTVRYCFAAIGSVE